MSKDIAESPTACRNAQRKKTTSQQDYMTTSCWGDVGVSQKKQFREDSCDFVDKIQQDKRLDLRIVQVD